MQEFDIDYNEIKEKHKEIVNSLNNYLPNNVEKIKVDENIAEALEDEEIQDTILIAQDLREKREAQLRIFEELKEQNPGYNARTMGNFIYSSFLTSNSKAAKDYNKALFDDFVANPDKYIFKQMDKLLQVPAKDLYKLETPLDYAKFYKDNYEVVEMASNAKELINNIPSVTTALKLGLPTYDRFIKLVEYAKHNTQAYESPTMLACPKLTKAQAEAIIDAKNNKIFHVEDDVLKHVESANVDDKYIAPKKFLQDLSARINNPNAAYNPNNKELVEKEYFKYVGSFMNDFVAVKKDDKTSLIDIDKFTYPENDKNVALINQKLTKKADAMCIVDGFKEKYIQVWQSKFVTERGKTGNYDIAAIEKEHRGGIFERLRGTTSCEYKDLIKALRDFSDENSATYMNYDFLKSKAQAYLAHKEAQGYGSTRQYSGTPLIRKNLAEAIIGMEGKHNEIFNEAKREFLNNMVPLPKEQLFHNQNEIIDESMEEEIEDKTFIIGADEIKKDSGIPHDDEFAKIDDYMDGTEKQ